MKNKTNLILKISIICLSVAIIFQSYRIHTIENQTESLEYKVQYLSDRNDDFQTMVRGITKSVSN